MDDQSNIQLYIFIGLICFIICSLCVVFMQYKKATRNCYDCQLALQKMQLESKRDKESLKNSINA